MDAVKFLEERKRMYESGAITPCIEPEDDYNPVNAVKIVEEWSAAHPRKTRQSVFLEQYPNAKLNNEGIVDIWPCCVEKNMQTAGQCNGIYCVDCRREFWMQEVE